MSKWKSLPPQEKLLKLFYYDPEDGMLYRRTTVAPNAKAGSEAGFIHKGSGYYKIAVEYEEFQVHRVIWKMLYDEDPQTLDHIDRDKLNNRQENLREVTESQNVHNVDDSRYIGASGFRGVHWHPQTKKWRACISINTVRKSLGLFNTPEAAREAYLKAAQDVW